MNELILKMIECKNTMFDTAVSMEYYGGLDEQIKEKSSMMLESSAIVGEWIEEMAAKYVS